MADYLILKQTASTWEVVNSISGKTANADGECDAIVQSFTGPGKYVALRIDNAQVMDVTIEPKLTEVEKVKEELAEELIEADPVEAPVEEPAVADDPPAEPSTDVEPPA